MGWGADMRTAEEPKREATDARKTEDATVMLTNELAGKHTAAQVYDERIWKIRTGFLTLTFASWGALLAVGSDLKAAREGAAPLLAITLALAVAGFVVEFFYVCRKARCVKVINDMSVNLYRLLESHQSAGEAVRHWLRFSGDDDEVSPKGSPLFTWAVAESLIIYLTPAVGFVVAYVFFRAYASR